MLNITLDQARALDALARHGTLKAAATALGRQHGSVVYALAQLEAQTELELLDRSGYRTRLTTAGEEVLVRCRSLLAALDELDQTAQRLRSGWEPTLRIVVDGIFPTTAVLRQLKALQQTDAPTRAEVQVEFLAGVEAAFEKSHADLMISVIRPQDTALSGVALAPLTARLLVARDHPLARKRSVTPEDLERHTLISVRGSDPRLELPTALQEPRAPIVLHGFHTKREALLTGLGYGWLPDYLSGDDLAAGRLCEVRYAGGSRHAFQPYAWTRRAMGRAARFVVDGLVRDGETPRTGRGRATRGSARSG